MTDAIKVIREQNDRLRQGDPTIPGQIFVTHGLTALLNDTDTKPEKLFQIVSSYSSFSPDNDPHEEHDFGSFKFQGQTCFWKIDYYDPTLKWGSDDPSDLEKTARVMTLMLADEY